MSFRLDHVMSRKSAVRADGLESPCSNTFGRRLGADVQRCPLTAA